MRHASALLFVLLLLRCLPGAAAEEAFTYTVTEVTGCEQADAAYDRFYQSGEPGVLIPGLLQGLVPQGITWIEADQALLFAGYRGDRGSSALLEVDAVTGELLREVRLQNRDGSVYNGHAGGVCATERAIYLSNNHHLYRISMETFLALPASADCSFEEEIPVPVNASFCCWDGALLWVGEFQYGLQYLTDAGHRVESADGPQQAWICAYAETADGLAEAPACVLSVTERIQGITLRRNSVYLSQSYGRRNTAMLYRYDNVTGSEADGEVTVAGQAVPLYVLDSLRLSDSLACPPMTECLCTVEDAVLVLFESAAVSYRDPWNPSRNPMDRVFRLTGF